MADFSSILRLLRNQTELSQQELANRIGISKSALNMYERGDRQPNFETLELIADYFNISLDFLLGKVSFIHCPICKYTYDPLSKNDLSDHNKFHPRYIEAEKKYGTIISRADSDRKRTDAIMKFRNPSLSLEERVCGYEEYLEYDFMRSLWDNGLSLEHDDFETFCRKDIGLVSTKEALDELNPEIYERLVEKYGKIEDDEYHKVTSLHQQHNRGAGKVMDANLKNISTSEEINNIIKKYSSLDAYGQETVLYILDRELERTNLIVELSKDKNISTEEHHNRIIQYYQRLASAGTGQIVFDSIPTDKIEIPDNLKFKNVDYAIGVNGNSMVPKYKDKDVVLVEQTDSIEIGEIGIFINEGEAFVKELGDKELISFNPLYNSIPLTPNTRCLGRVVGKLGDENNNNDNYLDTFSGLVDEIESQIDGSNDNCNVG